MFFSLVENFGLILRMLVLCPESLLILSLVAPSSCDIKKSVVDSNSRGAAIFVAGPAAARQGIGWLLWWERCVCLWPQERCGGQARALSFPVHRTLPWNRITLVMSPYTWKDNTDQCRCLPYLCRSSFNYLWKLRWSRDGGAISWQDVNHKVLSIVL